VSMHNLQSRVHKIRVLSKEETVKRQTLKEENILKSMKIHSLSTYKIRGKTKIGILILILIIIIVIIIIIIIIMALWPFVGPWVLFQFRDHKHSR
jgi:hypothetical protein